jgi:hypothetical protein
VQPHHGEHVGVLVGERHDLASLVGRFADAHAHEPADARLAGTAEQHICVTLGVAMGVYEHARSGLWGVG